MTAPEPSPPALSRNALLTRLAAIGLVLLIVAAGFAYTGGWLSPGRLTPGRFADEFQQVNGTYPGSAAIMPRGYASSASSTATARVPASPGPRSSRPAALR